MRLKLIIPAVYHYGGLSSKAVVKLVDQIRRSPGDLRKIRFFRMDFTVKTDVSGETDEDDNKAFGPYKGPGWAQLTSMTADEISSIKSFRLQQSEEERCKCVLGLYGVDPKLWSLSKLTLLDLSQPNTTANDEHKLNHLGPIDVNVSMLGLSGLTELRDVVLSNNNIGPTIEPSGCFLGLTHLRSLNLENNSITNLPPSLVSLTALVNLNINKNKLNGLPGNLGLLPVLQTISANSNNITCESLLAGATGLADSPRLSTLHLASNSLQDFLGKIKALSDLDVSNNQLTALPESLGSANLKLKQLLISNNAFEDKKLKKLAVGDKPQVKAILQLLRKGKSKRQAKVEQQELELASREPPERQYLLGEKDTPKQILLHRDVISVRPVICAVLLHVVEIETGDIKSITSASSNNSFFFADDHSGPSFETELALLEQKDFFNPRLTDNPDDNEGYGMDLSIAAVSTMEKFKAFINIQTQIHHNPELGNKRRHGAMGSHNAGTLNWPLHFTAAGHNDARFLFSPLRDGWMEGKGKATAKQYAVKSLRIPDLAKHAQSLLALPLCPFLYMHGQNNDENITVLSVAPLTNGWETRTTPLANGPILVECSSGDEAYEPFCRKMLLGMIKETINLIEGAAKRSNIRRVVLIEPVDVVRAWNKQLQTTFPSYDEFQALPRILLDILPCSKLFLSQQSIVIMSF